MSENAKVKSDFETPLAEASRRLRKLAEPCPAGDTLKAALQRAHRKVPQWTANRVRDIWNADPRVSVKASELSDLVGYSHQKAIVYDDTATEFALVVSCFAAANAAFEAYQRKNCHLALQNSERDSPRGRRLHRTLAHG